jgi:hypothetical protein
MKKLMVCPHCGAELFRKIVNAGYQSGRDMGRPKGARGVDLSYCGYFCHEHGDVTDNAIVREIPEWFDTLESFDVNLTGVETDRLTVTQSGVYDYWGNYLFPIPKNGPPDDWSIWLREEVNDYLEAME